ncbi:DUF5686 and carboxypeptidase-like regulatory domain-containing protein [Sediminitomix flava]|uniref:Carboxypeptidase-like protein n=1 Tax=Sediminitomix flava TaxID=379075 RepID=A0A316A5A0_SEDFL|nr:DUF5686 and carboxypeptidase-like regulatory domain-containing protein [Sediminitomix flava]PWJ44937.1 carboxypeptidase-like protein [Sediminitomix flava]
MKYLDRRYLLLLTITLVTIFPQLSFAQEFSISGRVTDTETGEGIPFANVYLKGIEKGAVTDFEGFYKFKTKITADTIVATYVGYQAQAKKFNRLQKVQNIDFFLTPVVQQLDEVTVRPGDYENPAWEILRAVIKNKKRNNKNGLDAFEYESYVRNEIDVDNITEKFRKRKIVGKMVEVVEKSKNLVGEDGQPIVPMFVSETISDVYQTYNPERRKEVIQKTRIKGLGIEDGSIVSQMTGSAFQEFNFYDNWIRMLSKEFVSPIADGWKTFYDYTLIQKMFVIDGISCYRIDFKPRQEGDLAFQGSMWIADEDNYYALKQIDVTLNQSANLNFIEKIKIQQTLTPIKEGSAWVPQKTRIILDIGQINDRWAGLLAKSYVSNKDHRITEAKSSSFYAEEVEVNINDFKETSEEAWKELRHDSLSVAEIEMLDMIDTIQNIPIVKTYIDIAETVVNGYFNLGKVEIGTYAQLYANNNIEGHRFQIGMTSNVDLSRKFKVKAQIAYGTKDEQFKYFFENKWFLSRPKWMILGFESEYDVERVGVFNDDLSNTNLFDASTKWGDFRRPFKNFFNKVYFQSDVWHSFTVKATIRNQDFDPLFNFQYEIPQSDGESLTGSAYKASELVGEVRYAPGYKFIQTQYNTRVVVASDQRPVLLFRYIYGVPKLFGGDFEYHKFQAGIDQWFRVGGWGRFEYNLRGGYIPSTLPYPLLENHLGNQSDLFYNSNSFNLMNFFEFTSDRYVSLRMIHRFEGVILNRIPLLKKLKWRLFVTGNLLYGDLSDKNLAVTQPTDSLGNQYETVNPLGDTPYAEVSYGVENIFRFIRVDFIHRLTYLDNPDVNNFGIKISAWFRL